MSATIGSNAVNVVNLGNLLAPASGVTHAAILDITLSNSTSQLNMVQLQTSLGYMFQAQAMTVDNTGNNAAVVVGEIVTGFEETIPAGVKRTFQFPSAAQAQFTFTSTGTVTFQALLYDFPAFPDTSATSAVAASVTILNQPIGVTIQTPSRVYTAGDAIAVAVGGTAVNAFNAASVLTEGTIINLTTNAAPIFVDPVNVATTAEGSNGTNIALQPGDEFTIEAPSGAVSVNSVAPQSFIAYRS